jgi:hypothetical protein
MLITFDAAHEALSQHFQTLWSVIDGAWNDYQTKIPDDVRAIASTRSRASLVHDFMVKRSLELEDTTSDVSSRKHRMMFVLIFKSNNGLIAMRLKKLDEDGISRNNPTKQVIDFRNQDIIPGLEARHHLEIGYILSSTQDHIQSIELVCPSGDGIYWRAEVTPVATRENVFNLWEHRGEEEQKGTGFTVTRREIRSDENESAG